MYNKSRISIIWKYRSTSSCPTEGAIGSLGVHKKRCIRSWFDHETNFGIDGTKIDIQITPKRPWESPETIPCVLLNKSSRLQLQTRECLLYRLQWIYRKGTVYGRDVAQSKKMWVLSASQKLESKYHFRIWSGNTNSLYQQSVWKQISL